ncbi:MAG: glycosyltransferase, partial [Melioribacteraceae bacterium]|nr:glycosyltransferase [Melioribacteraceae bacterium]
FGIPEKSCGGPRKIIYEILNLLDNNLFNSSYYSFNVAKKLNKNDYINLDNIGIISKLKNHIQSQVFYEMYYYKSKQKFLNNYIKQNKFDVIHSHNIIPMSMIPNINIPKILTIHSKGSIVNDIFSDNKVYSKLRKKYFQKLEKDALMNSDLITFPSKKARDLYFDDLEFDFTTVKKKVKIIYNGINIEKINKINKIDELELKSKFNFILDDSVLLINISEHVKLKNIDLLIFSMKSLVEKFNCKIKLINFGRGPLTEYLKRIVKDNNLMGNVFFFGSQKWETVISVMKRCNALVMASEKVVFDLVILEALASGIPILVTKDGGNIEIVNDNMNGFFIEKPNEDSIVKTVNRFMESNLKDEQIRINHFFDVARMVYEYELLYNSDFK